MREIRTKHLSALPRPICCREIQEKPIVFLTGITTYEGEPEEPKWGMTVTMPSDWMEGWSYYKETFVEVTKCPFCHSSMPELAIKENPPEPMMKISDGGYYCDTCQERLNCCECYPAETKYEVKRIK